jgi:hypothetical protein
VGLTTRKSSNSWKGEEMDFEDLFSGSLYVDPFLLTETINKGFWFLLQDTHFLGSGNHFFSPSL